MVLGQDGQKRLSVISTPGILTCSQDTPVLQPFQSLTVNGKLTELFLREGVGEVNLWKTFPSPQKNFVTKKLQFCN